VRVLPPSGPVNSQQRATNATILFCNKPVDTEVFALDPVTGATRWRVDHGSPGVGGSTTEPGTYGSFSGSPDPDTEGAAVVGLIVAEPYHD
jgi:hypothetical protein